MADVLIRINLGPRVPLDTASRSIAAVTEVLDLARSLDIRSAQNLSRYFSDDSYRRSLASAAASVEAVKEQLSNEHDKREQLLLQRLGFFDAFASIDAFVRLAYQTSSPEPPLGLQAAGLLGLTANHRRHPSVIRIRYENPFEILLTGVGWITAGGSAATATWGLLRFIRDYRPKQELAWAEARNKNAEAERTEAEARKKNAEADQEEAVADAMHTRAREVASASQFRTDLQDALLEQIRDGQLILTPEQLEAILSGPSVTAAFDLSQLTMDFERLQDAQSDTTSS